MIFLILTKKVDQPNKWVIIKGMHTLLLCEQTCSCSGKVTYHLPTIWSQSTVHHMTREDQKPSHRRKAEATRVTNTGCRRHKLFSIWDALSSHMLQKFLSLSISSMLSTLSDMTQESEHRIKQKNRNKANIVWASLVWFGLHNSCLEGWTAQTNSGGRDGISKASWWAGVV